MGNRAIITTRERKIGLYLHWNGGRDTVEPLLRYCELQGYRPPSSDSYGWARICQVVGNFFGGTLSVGVGPYTDDASMDPGDNGIYVIDGWRIAERLTTEYDEDWKPAGVRDVEPCEEQRSYDFDEMLRAFDESMPEDLRLGELLDSVEVPAGELEVGDEVWLREHERGWKAYPVVGFGQPAGNAIAVRVETADGKVSVTYPDLPYVARYDHDGDFSWNSNNYVHGETARIRSSRETGWECRRARSTWWRWRTISSCSLKCRREPPTRAASRRAAASRGAGAARRPPSRTWRSMRTSTAPSASMT